MTDQNMNNKELTNIIYPPVDAFTNPKIELSDLSEEELKRKKQEFFDSFNHFDHTGTILTIKDYE